MKKLLALLFVSMLIIVLAACGSDSSSANGESKEKPTASEQKEKSDTSESESAKSSSDDELTEVGQVSKDDEIGTLELVKMKDINETVDIAPLQVTVQNIKVYKLSDMTQKFQERMRDYAPTGTDFSKDLNLVEVNYTAENSVDSTISWYDLENVITDKGQQIDGEMNDIIVTDSDFDTEFIGKVKKEFQDGYIVKDADISKLKLIFGGTSDAESYDDITEEQTVEYSL